MLTSQKKASFLLVGKGNLVVSHLFNSLKQMKIWSFTVCILCDFCALLFARLFLDSENDLSLRWLLCQLHDLFSPNNCSIWQSCFYSSGMPVSQEEKCNIILAFSTYSSDLDIVW